MTRGMVKSKLMHERKWVIRSQVPNKPIINLLALLQHRLYLKLLT